MSQRNKSILAAVLLLIAGGVFYWQAGLGKPRPYTEPLQFADATTGKLYALPRETRVYPVVNPETGLATLVPCYKGEDGNWYLKKRYRDLLKVLGDSNKSIDPETLRIEVVDG